MPKEQAIQRLDEAITEAIAAGLSREEILAEVHYLFDTPEEPAAEDK